MKNEQDPMELRLEALAYHRAGADDERGVCPDDETFGAFMDGRLEGKAKEAVLTHLSECPSCRRALEAWREAERAAPAVPGHLVDEARGLVKRPLRRVALKLLVRSLELLNPGEAPLFSPEPREEPVPCRGGAGSTAAEQEAVLEIATGLPAVPCVRIQHLEVREEVRITFLADPSLSRDEIQFLRLDLHGEEGLLQSWPLDPKATVMNPVSRGTYRVVLCRINSSSASSPSEPLGTLVLDLN